MDGPDPRKGGTPLILGAGCRAGADPHMVAGHARDLLREAGGSPACVATIELRRDEPALLHLARMLGVPLRTFPAATLDDHSPRLTHRSARVHALTGCWGVAESAALAAAGPGGRLLVPRRSWPMLTLALAVSA